MYVSSLQAPPCFDESGQNLAHVFFISRKKILAWFYFDNPTPFAKMRGKLGHGQGKIMLFSTDLDQNWHMYFSSPRNKYCHCLIIKNQHWGPEWGNMRVELMKIMYFLTDLDQTWYIIFYPLQTSTDMVSYRKTNIGGQNGGREWG